MGKFGMLFNTIKSLLKFYGSEIRRGTFRKNFTAILKMRPKVEMSWAELIEEKSKKFANRIFLTYTYNDTNYTYKEMNENANRIGNFLKKIGGDKGKGIAIFMDNTPRFYDIFIGNQKIGMYSVPVNTQLKGESMLYILNHSDAEYLVIDETYAESLNKIKDKLTNIKTIIVNTTPETATGVKIEGAYNLDDAYKESSENPNIDYNKDDICFITYTSGTTGLPKGVVYRYRNSSVKLISLVANLVYKKSDIMYTCMKLFHGNALFVTSTTAMHIGARVVLARNFSASKFWEDIRKFNVTTFNTIGAMIPILMKQPEAATDNQNDVRIIVSAACPPDLWEDFEKRYGLKIYETYGAVDGGGKTIINLGTAPVGSIGKPPLKLRYKLMDEKMNEVPDGTPGELVFISSGKSSSKKGGVEYYKNEEASKKKEGDGYIRTGDLMKKDSKGFLYFVGRNTESMRIKGENVSAYEVEQTLMKHPEVLEAAVYAVPSELAEDDIMASIQLVEGKKVKESDVIEFAKENLPKFAVPRYIKIVKDFNRTVTHRIIKKDLEDSGIVKGTYDNTAP